MAFIFVAAAGAVAATVTAVTGATVGLVSRFMDRYIIVANDTSQPIFVIVEHEEGKSESLIEARKSMKFTVSNNKPITTRVKKSKESDTHDAEVCDYDYRNFIARNATTGDLILVRAKKGEVWEADPCKPNEKKKDSTE